MKDKDTKHLIKAIITELNEDPHSSKLATATIIICNSLYVNDLGVYKGKDNLYVSMPKRSKKDKNGNVMLFDVARAGSPEMNKAIHNAVIGAYFFAKARSDDEKAQVKKKAKAKAKYGYA